MASLLQWFSPGETGSVWSFAPEFARPRHHHPEVELNVVLEGSARFNLGPSVYPVHVPRGESECLVVCFPSMVEHELVEASPDLRMWILYAPPMGVTRDELELRTSLHPLVRAGVSLLRGLEVEALHEACRRAFIDQTASARRHAFIQVGRSFHLGAPIGPRSAHRVARRALQLLDSELTLSRRDLAERVGASEGELSRLVHRAIGVPLVTHRNRLRLARFLDELPASRSLLDAALRAGFGSSASLHRVFQREARCSPDQYLRGGAEQLSRATKHLELATDRSGSTD